MTSAEMIIATLREIELLRQASSCASEPDPAETDEPQTGADLGRVAPARVLARAHIVC